ncbi:MAG: hypothetical protein ACK4GQ_04685 [Candidatus Hadarchaeales archaeon]
MFRVIPTLSIPSLFHPVIFTIGGGPRKGRDDDRVKIFFLKTGLKIDVHRCKIGILHCNEITREKTIAR